MIGDRLAFFLNGSGLGVRGTRRADAVVRDGRVVTPGAALGGRLEGGNMGEPVLTAERLDVYRVVLEFAALATTWRSRSPIYLRDQLDRASASIVLNVAEGSGGRTGPDRSRFLAIARGSATECAAILDLLRVRAVVSVDVHREGRLLIVRIVQMLSRLTAPGRA